LVSQLECALSIGPFDALQQRRRFSGINYILQRDGLLAEPPADGTKVELFFGGDIAVFGKHAQQASLRRDWHRIDVRLPPVARTGAA